MNHPHPDTDRTRPVRDRTPPPGTGFLRPRRCPVGLTLLLAAGLLTACVTERPGRPTPSRTSTPAAQPTAVALPDHPVAAPVPTGATVSTQLNLRVVPLGTVPYDGQVLPLVSPDGNFIAVEQGDAPTWPTLLASPDATISSGTRIAVYDASKPPLREIIAAEPLPRGVILGRSSNARGYLVEWPRSDGARWIGLAPWAGAKVEWLVQGPDVSAHAVLDPDGTLAFTRRAPGADRSELVVRTPEGAALVYSPAGASCCFPIIAGGGNVVCTLTLSSAGLEFVALRIKHADGTRPLSLGSPLASRVLSVSGDLTLAYQTVAGVPGAPIEHLEEPSLADQAVLFFHPGLQRMAAFWWRDGSILPLAIGSIAAAHSRFIDPPGFLQTAPEGLVFSPMPADINAGIGKLNARVMEAGYVPRAAVNAERPLVLIGPASRKDPGRLTVVGCSIIAPETQK